MEMFALFRRLSTGSISLLMRQMKKFMSSLVTPTTCLLSLPKLACYQVVPLSAADCLWVIVHTTSTRVGTNLLLGGDSVVGTNLSLGGNGVVVTNLSLGSDSIVVTNLSLGGNTIRYWLVTKWRHNATDLSQGSDSECGSYNLSPDVYTMLGKDLSLCGDTVLSTDLSRGGDTMVVTNVSLDDDNVVVTNF